MLVRTGGMARIARAIVTRAPARWQRTGQELVITPARPIADRQRYPVVDDLADPRVDECGGCVVGLHVRVEVRERRHQPEAAPCPAGLVLLLAREHEGACVEARKEVANFLNDLDDHDDVHRVYAAMK